MIRLERRPYCPILSNLLSGWRDLDRLQSTIRRPQSENSHSRLSNPFASTRAQQHPGLFWTAVITTREPIICGVGGNPEKCGITKDTHRFAPRAGMALRLTENTVIRAG